MAELLLDAETVGKSARILHIEVMRVRDGLNSYRVGGAAGGVFDIPVEDRYLVAEWRVVDAAEDEIALNAFIGYAETAAHNGFLLAGQVVSEADAGCVITPARGGPAERKVMEQSE